MPQNVDAIDVNDVSDVLKHSVDGMDDAVGGDDVGVDDVGVYRRRRDFKHRTFENLKKSFLK